MNLWNDGAEIRNGCLKRTLQDPEAALLEWTERVMKAMSDLDPSYVIEFSNQSGLVSYDRPIQFDNVPETDKYFQTYQWVNWRMEKLQAVTSELRKGYVISMR